MYRLQGTGLDIYIYDMYESHQTSYTLVYLMKVIIICDMEIDMLSLFKAMDVYLNEK